MLGSHSAQARGRASGSVRYNLVLLACAVLGSFVTWTIIGELIGDVVQSDGDSGGLLADVIAFVGSILIISVVYFVLFIPGFGLFLLLLRAITQRFRMSLRAQRILAVVLSPVIGAVFIAIPAIPEDRDDVWSGWWYILGTVLIVALAARLPLREASRSN